jgi:hypothetical protein
MTSAAILRAPAEADDCYAFLEWQSNEVTRSLVGFTGLITPAPDNLSAAQWQNLTARYATIKEWHSTTLELFSASLKGLVTPAIAELFLREIPPYLASYHRDIVSSVPINTPMFFRTDEAVLGKIVEVQSPGSLWGTYEQLQDYYGVHDFCGWHGFIREVGGGPGHGDQEAADYPPFLQSVLGERKLFRAKGEAICPLLWIR